MLFEIKFNFRRTDRYFFDLQGYEVNGAYLYHASVPVEGGSRRVPGKTGQHLGSATAAYGNAEVVVKEGYEILCWR